MTRKPTPAGFIIENGAVVDGIGETEEQAWDDWARVMRMSGVVVIEDGEPIEDDRGHYVRRSQYRAKPATKALLDVLDEEGGAFPWSEADGVACTLREAEDASPEDDGG